MKELSIEEKAKAYDEAIKRAKELLEIGVKDTRDKRVVLSFFPELKESEDERTRKELINFVNSHLAGFPQCEKYITWLEKQGDNADKVVYSDYDSIDPYFGKPINKVEPKYKIGDWVVFSNHHQSIYQVEKIENGYYILRHTHGGTFRICVLHDESLRLWNFNDDAKEGDVLDANGAPFIYKKHDKDCVYFYCGVNLAGEFIEANGIDIWNNNYKVYPATKEQRDTLEKAMLKAGCKRNKEERKLEG